MKVFSFDIFWHVAREDPAHGNDGGGVRAEQDGAGACLIAAVYYGIQGQGHTMMQLCYRLTRAGWRNSWVIVDVEGGKEGLESLCRSRSRVLERGGAIPFCQAGLRQDEGRWGGVRVGQDVDKGLEGLEAAVVGAGEDGVDGRVQGDQVSGQLVGLVDTVGSQGRVGRYARW